MLAVFIVYLQVILQYGEKQSGTLKAEVCSDVSCFALSRETYITLIARTVPLEEHANYTVTILKQNCELSNFEWDSTCIWNLMLAFDLATIQLYVRTPQQPCGSGLATTHNTTPYGRLDIQLILVSHQHVAKLTASYFKGTLHFF